MQSVDQVVECKIFLPILVPTTTWTPCITEIFTPRVWVTPTVRTVLRTATGCSNHVCTASFDVPPAPPPLLPFPFLVSRDRDWVTPTVRTVLRVVT